MDAVATWAAVKYGANPDLLASLEGSRLTSCWLGRGDVDALKLGSSPSLRDITNGLLAVCTVQVAAHRLFTQRPRPLVGRHAGAAQRYVAVHSPSTPSLASTVWARVVLASRGVSPRTIETGTACCRL